ncbi:hypothetical protein [Oceanobacillus halophilus]|uniref:ABC transporter permease n=1 Tax=Oceanobacillus halophilus TaxID=930130 RepID=A0A494ZT76_9BACI|nr:hypothetical protein [Oceanobacillus halophilus]RKQ28127.1 hypothetical protein D8M06_19365 [Oceanobacillus halophilus]
MLEQAFWLAKKEFKFQWLGFTATILFTLILGIATAFLLDISAEKVFINRDTPYNRLLLDLIFIGITPSFAAIYMSKPYLSFQTIKDDTFTKRMALLRSLPIPVKVLSASRTIVMLMTLSILSFIFYGVIYLILVTFPMRFLELMSFLEFVSFIAIWFGYALAVGGMIPYIEYGTSGKVLHLTPFISIAIFIAIIIIVYSYVESGIVEIILYFAKENGILLAIASMIIGISSTYLWNRLLTNRLAKRDYL